MPWEPSSEPWDGWPKMSPGYRAYHRARKAGGTWTSYDSPSEPPPGAEPNQARPSEPTPWVFCVLGGIKNGLVVGLAMGFFVMLGMLVISLVFGFFFDTLLTDLLVLVTCGAALIGIVVGTILGTADGRSYGYR